MNWFKPKSPTQVLGLTLDHGRLEAALVHRTNGSVTVAKTVSVPLAMDPLRNEPELVGREIRNHLDAAGVKEKRCVVGLPLGWVVTVHSAIPAIDAADVPAFLEIEAERGFPRSPDELQVAVSRHTGGAGTAYATQIALPRDYVARLEAILEAAQLRPLSFSPGILALPDAVPTAGAGRLTMLIDEAGVELLVAVGGGVAGLRTIPGVFDEEGGNRRIQTDLLARELRITLGQMPEELRSGLRSLVVSGPPRLAQQVSDELRVKAGALGLSVGIAEEAPGTVHGLAVSNGMVVTAAVGLAARYLAGAGMGQEFLPPKPSLWEQVSERYSTRRLAWAGGAAAAVVVVALGMFAYQQVQLSSLRSQWNGMRKRVATVEELQAQVRKCRPWYAENVGSLAILRKVTDAFPEEGAVAAKTFEIRNQSAVTVTGTARDHASLLRTLEKLRGAREVGDVRVDQIRGKSPMQFTFNFQWGEAVNP